MAKERKNQNQRGAYYRSDVYGLFAEKVFPVSVSIGSVSFSWSHLHSCAPLPVELYPSGVFSRAINPWVKLLHTFLSLEHNLMNHLLLL